MSSSKDCIIAARAELTMFHDDELKHYVAQVLELARTYPDVKGSAGVRRAIEEINNVKVQQLAEDLQRKVNDAAKLDKNSKSIVDGKATLREMLVKRGRSLTNNITAAQRAARNMLVNAFYGQLEKEEFAHLADGKSDLDIVRAIDGKKAQPLSEKIAKKFMDYIGFRNGDMVSSDALSIYHLNDDRFLRAIHDRSKLASGGMSLVDIVKARGKPPLAQARANWKDFIKGYLDIEKTFRDTDALEIGGTIDAKAIDKILNDIYDNIVTDKADLFAFGGKPQRMFFYWKDFEAMYNYSQRYGQKDLMKMIMSDVQSSGNKIGMAEIFGTSPQKTYNALAELDRKHNPKFSAYGSFNDKNTFKILAGIDQAPVSASVATFFSTLRTLSGMKALGRIAIQSLPDVSNSIAYAKRWGFDYWGAYADNIAGLFNALPSEERVYMAKVFRISTDQHLGYVARFIDANDLPQALRTASTYFYRGIGMESLDKGQKVSSLYIMSKGLGGMSNRTFDQLPQATRKQFAKYDFTATEWDVLRKKNTKGLFTTDNVEMLTNEEVRAMYGATAEQPLYHLKRELYRKVYSMFDSAVENAVLNPDAMMQAITTAGIRSGTIHGEILRSIMQFKTYSMSYIDRVLYQGFSDADTARAKMGYAVQLIAATLPMSFLSYYLNNLAQGKSMPSFDAMNFAEKRHYALELTFPGFGILNSLFDPNKQSTDLTQSALGGSSINNIATAVNGILKLTGGDTKTFTKSMKKLAHGMTPGVSLPFVDPYLREIMGEKPRLLPGQKQYFGA